MLQRSWLVAALALAAVVAGVAGAHPGAVNAVDEEQPRLNVAAPLPIGPAQVTQTLRPLHAGLSAIELLAVVYPPGDAASEAGTLTLELRDAAGQVIAHQTFTSLAHNAPLALTFDPQPHSAGQTYTLALAGPPGNHTTVWAYSLDGYASGELRFDGVAQPGDLRFTTRYTYLWADVARDAAAALALLARVAVPVWLVLFAPGLLLLGGSRSAAPLWATPAARWGAALGLSLAVVALLWLWIGVLGLRWSPLGLSVVYAVIGLAVALRWLTGLWRGPRRWSALRPDAHTLALVALLALGLLARLLAARDLLLPQWVDGPHHYTIARVLAEAGQVPASYQPLLPIDAFNYHFGFHALAVTLGWLTGQPLPATFMWLGQVLQGLVPLGAYAAVVALTGRVRAGCLAAACVALISYFPGYYLTWGRFTQLAGTLLLFPALALAWRVAAGTPGAERARRDGWAEAALLGLLAAGLFVTHYAVFVVWVCFAALAVLFHLRRGLRPMLLAAGVGALLAGPWLLRLGAAIAEAPLSLAAPAGYNAFPWEYFNRPLERGWLTLAGLALAWGLLRRDRPLWLVAAWMALLGGLVNLGGGNWLVTNNTLAIMLFVPGALVLGWGADRWLTHALNWLSPATGAPSPVARRLPWLRPAAGGVMLAALGLGLGYGAAQGLTTQVNIVNPATVLVTRADQAALAWVDAHVPASAVFLVNSWEWLNGTWAGSDAGAWLWPLLGRASTVPPADYAYGDAAWQAQVSAFNRQLRDVTDAEAPATLALLRGAGVTHVFLGARGGSLQPEMFLDHPHYRLLYTNGADWVFEFTAAQSRVPK